LYFPHHTLIFTKLCATIFQTLCILSNVADGDKAKEFIMSNEDVLKKLMNYMVISGVKHSKHHHRELVETE